MNDIKVLVTKREVLYIICAVFIFFEIYLMEEVNLFRYMDEAIAVACLIKVITSAFQRKLDRMHIYMLLMMALLMCIGLASNYFAEMQTHWKPIVTDIGSTFKVFVTYIGASLYLRPVKSKKRIISALAVVMRCFVVVLFGCMVLHFTGIYRMGNDVRYGLPSFQFINFGAGQLSFMFYAVFLILTADLRYDDHKKNRKILFLILAGIVWVSTLRTRAFMYVLGYVGLYYLIIVKNYHIRFNWKTVLLAAAVLYIFSADQVDLYFNNPDNARARFLRFGFFTMERFFPFGAGFATYGTDAAVVYYSRLYNQYRFPLVWGLSPSYPIFAHDTYWPAIMGQFGAFGLVVMILILVCLCLDIIKKSKCDKYAYLAGMFIIITQVSSSIATATFFHFVTLGLFFLVPLLFEEKETTNESRENDETSNRLHPNLQPG